MDGVYKMGVDKTGNWSRGLKERGGGREESGACWEGGNGRDVDQQVIEGAIDKQAEVQRGG